MTELSRRDLAKQALQAGGFLTVLAALGLPAAAAAFDNPAKTNPFLNRDDLDDALKSLYMTYDSTSPYPHKFNDVLSKARLRGFEFYVTKGLEKEYVKHYLSTMKPVFKKIKEQVKKDGPEKGLYSMFEGTSAGFQLYERIDIKPGERSFPCPYKGTLENCKKWLGTFTIEWPMVCGKWCTPIWKGFADDIGIKINIQPGETCKVTLA
jgi:hypothetical protein